MIAQNVEVRDFSFVVVAENQNPSILNPDFLKYTQIVPPDWELAMPPICTPAWSQVVFKTGVNIVAQSDKIIFWEVLDSDNIVFHLPEIVGKYIDTVPYVDYQAVGININAHIVEAKKEDNQDTVLDKLIASGKWKNFRGKLPSTVVQLTYKLDDASFNISIQEAVISKVQSNDSVSIINLSANFHRDLPITNYPEKIDYVKNIIESWQTDFNTFISFVEEAFLE